MKGDQTMQTRHNTLIASLALAGMLTLLVGQGFGQDASDRAAPRKLEGTWDVILKFPKRTCDRTECSCPGGVPNIPIVTLNTFLQGGGMLWSSNALLTSIGQGGWKRLGRNQFETRFKFYIFDLATGFSTSSEEVTQDIHLTGRDTYTGTMTYDLFDAEGNMTAQGCLVNIDAATRFE
jgi:hypothetical protein